MHNKQLCLARNRLGMLCHCQALSSGRCVFHGPLSAQAAAKPSSQLFASFSVWADLFGAQAPAGYGRNTPLPA